MLQFLNSTTNPKTRMLALLRRIDLIRLVVGIMLIIDGPPLIFFVKETLKFGSGSTVLTALILILGFVLMVPFTFLRRLYRYNSLLMILGIGSLLFMIFYMLVYSQDQAGETSKDLIYYTYIFVFLFLLINTPNDILEVFIPVVILFTLVSNLALVYSLIKDPTWVLGQRAAIQFGEGDTRSSNPHVFARNALMNMLACGIWMSRSKTDFLTRILAGISLLFSTAILIATLTRSSILALVCIVTLFMYFNLRPAQIKQFVRGLTKPLPLTFIAVAFFSIPYILQRYYYIFSIVIGYTDTFISKNLDNIYALLGMKASGTSYAATLDASSANRSISTGFLSNILLGHQEQLIFGYGYKAQYLDIPIVEALVTLGIFGFLLYGSFIALTTYYSLRAIRFNLNPMSTFLGYFFIYLLVQQFTNGRPNETSFWYPFCLMIRFLGVEFSMPARFWSSPEEAKSIQSQSPTELVAQSA